MTYLKLKIDELLQECKKRNVDVEYYKEVNGGKLTKKNIVQILITDDEEKSGELPECKAPVKHIGEEPKLSVNDTPSVPTPSVPVKVSEEPKELTEEDIKKIMDENDTEDDICKAIISIPTDKDTKEAILPKSREELEQIISFNIEGNVNMICGKLHQRVKALETELAKKKKGKVIKQK